MVEQEENAISEFVKKHLPKASLAEQIEAQKTVDRYLLSSTGSTSA